MSTQSKRTTTNTVGTFYGKSFKTRVLENNVRGKPLDKLTHEHMQASHDPHRTIYGQDYGRAQSIDNPRSQHFPVQEHKASAPKLQNGSANANVSVPVKPTQQETANIKPQPVRTEAKKEVHECGHPATDRKATSQTNFDAQSIHEDMKRSYMANPHVQVDEEAEYYETVRRLDVCGTCWAAQQKYYSSPFKLKQKGPGVSLYQKDYVKHPLSGKGPVLKNDFYSTFNINEPIDFGTTMRNDYKAWKPDPAQRFGGDRAATSNIPFGGKSGYKAEYIDWGAMPVNYEKAPNSKTVISELPFVGKSAYQDNFGNTGGEPSRPLEKSKNKSPLSPGIPFLGETTHSKTYKPFKVGGAPMFVTKEEYEPTEAYPNQFKTLYNQDFTAPHNWKCPAKIFMENHPHPRQKYLKP